MTRSTPNPGDRYRHWQGNECVIDSIDSISYATESRYVIRIANGRRAIAAHDIQAKSTIVIYRSKSGKLWARSIENFCGVLLKGRQRFERIAEGDRDA